MIDLQKKYHKMIKARIIYGILLFLISMQNYAQGIVTDRPDQTESSSTVERKVLQIESGLAFESFENGVENNFIGPSTLLRYGISNTLELRFASAYQLTKIEFQGADNNFSGFSDLEFGAKVQILKKENVNTEIAFLSHLIIPTAKTDITSNNIGSINKLAISHSISNKVSLGYNVGYDFVVKQSALTYSLALGFSISDRVGFYIEPYGSWVEQNQFESNFDTGLTFLLNPNFQLDVSYGAGFNHKMEYVAAGFSWKIHNFLVDKKH